ncbi:Uncharacterised protein [Burkholderia pseudomallei]|nr:Uncharacterised protein [Burkholderia pseudomallei]
MPIRQTHIWIFGFVIACVLAMSGPLTYTFENTFQQTVDIDRKKQGTVAEATAFDARSAEQPSETVDTQLSFYADMVAQAFRYPCRYVKRTSGFSAS